LGIVAFAFQIYFDFSGYSDMAIGLGSMLGFKFPENFNFPYISQSITEFWRRWHISLGVWFREYVYIPLGGNRVAPHRHIFNIFAVWALTGLWHGAAWNYVLWGLYYFVLLIAEKYFLGKFLKMIPAFFSVSITLFFTLMGWVIFAIEDLSFMGSYFTMLFGLNNTPLVSGEGLYLLTAYLPQIVISALASTPIFALLHKRLKKDSPAWLPLATGLSLSIAFFLSTAYLVDSTYNPFLYFRF
jgi:alginate O-acetyltransferase complex protein AlgI